MKFCKRCHRLIVDKLEGAEVKICKCDVFYECDASLEVVKTRLKCSDNKTLSRYKNALGLNVLGMSVT